MILDDRPHKLQYLITAPGYEDKNGDYHQGESRWEGDIPCRNVPAALIMFAISISITFTV